MAINADSFAVGSDFRTVGEIDATTDNPTVTITYPEGSVGPYLESQSTPGGAVTETLITEMVLNISPSGGSTTFERFYLTGGAIPSGKTKSDRLVEYNTTVRGMLNNEKSDTPAGYTSDNYRIHPHNSFVTIDETSFVKSLETKFDASVAAADNKYVQFQLFSGTQNASVGDGRAYFKIPAGYNAHNLSAVTASVITAGTTGTLDIQIYNVTQAADMLSTKLTIDSGETTSETAATPAVIDTANDDVATNDLIRVDIKAVHTTPSQGLILGLTFNDPS